MMRMCRLTGVTLAISLFVDSAGAQMMIMAGPNGNAVGSATQAVLQDIQMLRAPLMQSDLGVRPDQAEALNEVAERLQQEMRDAVSNLAGLSGEEVQRGMESIGRLIETRATQSREKVDRILDANQRGRLKQLSWQQRGALAALEDADVADALQLTAEQRKQVQDLRKEMNAKQQKMVRELMGPGESSAGGPRMISGSAGGGIGDTVAIVQQEFNLKALELLTPEQKQAFEKLKGPRFTTVR